MRVTTTAGDLESVTAFTTTWSAEQTARRVHGLSSPPALGPLRVRPYAARGVPPDVVEDGAEHTPRKPSSCSQTDSFKGASGEEACRVTCRGVIRCVTSGETPHNLFNLISELGKLPVFFPGLSLTLHTRSASKGRACESDTIARSSPVGLVEFSINSGSSSVLVTLPGRADCTLLSRAPCLSCRDRGSEGDTRNSATSGDRRADETTSDVDAVCPRSRDSQRGKEKERRDNNIQTALWSVMSPGFVV